MGRQSDNTTIERIRSPHNITIYRNGDNPNHFYYFRWNKRSYRGSTGYSEISQSRNKSIEIFFEISKGLRRGTREKIYKFKEVSKLFIQHKENQGLTKKTLVDYKVRIKFLTHKFKDEDVTSLCSKSIYEEYFKWRRIYYDKYENKRVQTYKKNGHIIRGRTFQNVSNAPINRELRILVSILRYCKEYLHLFENITIPSYERKPEKRREEVLTRDEYLKLREYWLEKKQNRYYWNIISFLNNTGIRYPSELNEIRWKDVHLDKSYVLIRNRKTKYKNSNPLDTPVPLIGNSKIIIEELLSRDGISKGPEDFVFVNDNGRHIKNITKSFKQSLIDCGISSNLSMYSFRHLFTTRMIKRPDIPLFVLSRVLGHKDTTMIEKVYGHLRVEDMVNTFQKSEDKKQEIIRQRDETT